MHAINQIINLNIQSQNMLATSMSDNVNKYVLSEDLKESIVSDCFTDSVKFGSYDTEALITISFCSTMWNNKSDSMTIMSTVEHIFEVHWGKFVNNRLE